MGGDTGGKGSSSKIKTKNSEKEKTGEQKGKGVFADGSVEERRKVALKRRARSPEQEKGKGTIMAGG